MLKRIRDLFSRKGSKPSAGSTNLATSAVDADASRPARSARPPIHHGPRVVHQPIPKQDIDPDAYKIVQRLTRFDHAAYLVGGCVRDLLLNRRPKDFDLGTSATPRQVRRLFRNCRIIGRRFRLAHIYFQNGKIIEVATFRGQDEDAGGADGEDLLIRDDNRFGSMEEDALRRDFTINSLFYDVNDETVLDHADGLGDLKRKLVRTIGDPEVRFREDPIRILRAIKFAARLEFKIEDGTLAALRATRREIPKAASPRILEEINRFCRGGAARRSFEGMRETGVFEVVLPELSDEYARDDSLRRRLDDLLDAIDERVTRKIEASTGEIFASLLFPLLAAELDWVDGESARPVRGIDLKKRIDDRLRPIATRLRVSRRDQEACRQILSTLFRMVPSRRVHRNTKRAVLSRDCFDEALNLLRTIAGRNGGEFSQAVSYWTEARGSGGAAQPDPPARDGETGRRDDRPRARRRRGRGRGRAAAEATSGGGAAEAQAEAPPGKSQEKLPSPWDDNYFFAALPTVPEGERETGSGDRYGAQRVSGGPPDADDSGPEAERQTGEAETPPVEAREPGSRPKRRRRSRRRRGGGGSSTGGETTGNDPA